MRAHAAEASNMSINMGPVSRTGSHMKLTLRASRPSRSQNLGLVKVKETLSSHPDHRKPVQGQTGKVPTTDAFALCTDVVDVRPCPSPQGTPCQWAEADCTKTAFHTMSPYCETSILATKHNKPLINDVNCLSSTRALGTGGRPDHGPKKGATNLEAGF